MASVETAADLRACVARARVPLYAIAARINRHPVTLGRWLNERLPMPAEAAGRIIEAVRALEQERRGR